MNICNNEYTSTGDEITALVGEVLNTEDFYKCNQNIQRLAEIFGDITQITVEDDENAHSGTLLNEGNAISPVQAAKCLTQMTRTRQFWLGIKAAVEDCLSQNESMDILYAGTGPYGTILLPLLPLLAPKSMRLVCLDIHEENVVAIRKIIEILQPELADVQLVCADATKWQPSKQQSFDLIISETMNAYLHREPQVSIFAHLEQFLKISGSLIPQEIVVEAWLSKHKKYNIDAREMEDFPAAKLDELMRLDRQLARSIRENTPETLSQKVDVPTSKQRYRGLELRTDISIFRDIGLTLNQCSLNIPKNHMPAGGFPGGKTLTFTYRIFNNPDWDIDIPGSDKQESLVAADSFGRLEMNHLKRLWQKLTLNILNIKCTELSDEINLDLALMECLGISYGELMELVDSSLPDFKEFEYLLEDSVGKLTNEKVSVINEKMANLQI